MKTGQITAQAFLDLVRSAACVRYHGKHGALWLENTLDSASVEYQAGRVVLRLYTTDGRGHGITMVSLSDVRRVEILRFSEDIVAVGIDCGESMERYELYIDLPEKEKGKKNDRDKEDVCMQEGQTV